ncbi:hypothetical protein [Streptomyces lonarensis]|uniref:Uncharacterized protein n=1 Tax=Streptomyces lonarensis TaxID=700599 RepID=A0A7X6CXM7_9ACTN|nr:hypothetical protein [Streptomyces lonarensis]NJQ04298.1 hypothetical protein [Streptomyces lonarensis]
MAAYRRRPIEVDAVRADDVDTVAAFIGEHGRAEKAHVTIPGVRGLRPGVRVRTLDGSVLVAIGDYLIRKPDGELMAIGVEEFNNEYEEVRWT